MIIKKLLLVSLAVIYLFSLPIFISSVHAADDATDKLKWLNAEEKAWVFKLRQAIAQTRGAVSMLRGDLDASGLGELVWAGRVGVDVDYVAICCNDIWACRTTAPKVFQPIVGEFDAIDELGASVKTQGLGLEQNALTLAKGSKLLWVLYYPVCLIRVAALKPAVSKVQSQTDIIEAALDKRIAEASKNREEAAEFLSKCFIATAAYGSETAPQLDILRAFRDKSLMKSEVGRSFVDTYYYLSPSLADYIRDKDAMRWIVRFELLDPIVFILKNSQQIYSN